MDPLSTLLTAVGTSAVGRTRPSLCQRRVLAAELSAQGTVQALLLLLLTSSDLLTLCPADADRLADAVWTP